MPTFNRLKWGGVNSVQKGSVTLEGKERKLGETCIWGAFAGARMIERGKGCKKKGGEVSRNASKKVSKNRGSEFQSPCIPSGRFH